MNSVKVLCLSEAMSPITHMAKTAGNEAIIAREPVINNGRVLWVPYLSGNAIRHRVVREPGFRWLIDQYGLGKKLTLQQLNFLLHGGNRLKGSGGGGREDLSLVANMHRLFPLLRLMGGTLPDQIIGGCLFSGRGTLVCRENKSAIMSLMPSGWTIPEGLFSFEHFVGDYTYTRGDVQSTAPYLADSAENKSESQQMIFSGQAVSRGAIFLHQFVIQNASTLELGALLWSLQLWQHKGGTIGGQSSRGHGKFQTHVVCAEDIDVAVGAYLEHAVKVADEAKDWLMNAFTAGPKTRGPKKGKNESLAEIDSADSVV